MPYKRQFAADLCRFIRERHAQGRHLVITGDLNVAPEEIDLANPATNRLNPGFTDEERPRTSAPTSPAARPTSFFLGNAAPARRDSIRGGPSAWAPVGLNVGWRIDIFLVSHALREKVTDAAIHPEVPGSDHCPVSLDLAL